MLFFISLAVIDISLGLGMKPSIFHNFIKSILIKSSTGQTYLNCYESVAGVPFLNFRPNNGDIDCLLNFLMNYR